MHLMSTINGEHSMYALWITLLTVNLWLALMMRGHTSCQTLPPCGQER